MFVDLYSYFCSTPDITNKVIGGNYLSAEYKCPINVEDFKFWNEMHLISYVISGRKDWFSGGEKYEVSSGDAIFIKKGVYTTKQYFDVDHCIVIFMLNDDFIKRFLQEYGDIRIPAPDQNFDKSIIPIDVNEGIQSIIFSVAQYLKLGSNVPKELVEIKFKELLFNLILNPKNHLLAQFFDSIHRNDRLDLEYVMNKNFNHDLSLEEYARMCGRSLSTFKRDFQESFGQTPGKWLLEKRLDFAKSLLMTTNLNINEICYDSGFKNNSHFNRAFKDRFNLPPLQFRQKLTSV